MNKVLIVGDYNRSDFLYPAKLFHNEIEFYFIEHLNEKYIGNKEVFQFGKVIFWKDFSDAYDLLEKIAPTSIIFYFLEAYNHVALNVAARAKSIRTYHLEHGVRFFVEGASFNYDTPQSLLKKILGDPLGFTSNAFDKLKNKRFYNKTLRRSAGNAKECLEEFYRIRSTHGILDTFKKTRNNLRWPVEYISFSPLVFEYHKSIEYLPENYPVHFIGIPTFDHFAQWKNLESVGNGVLFIDQPLHEQNLMGWTEAFKKEFLSQLSYVVSGLGRKLFIKPHPWNDKGLYQNILNDANTIVADNDWNNIIHQIDTVLGFSSTLLMPFMAMEQICCFAMEMHPIKGAKPYSYFFLDSGACNAVHTFEELEGNFSDSKAWHEKQKLMKKNFIDKYLFRFDGKSSERLKDILLSS